jgi:DNA modification methylase
MFIRDRIRELRRVPAGQLRPNPKNWRTHPPAQRDALKGLLAELGYCDALLARELADGTLELIDGHLRAETTPDLEVPVLVLDVTAEEAAKLLLTLDPLASLAEANLDQLTTLLASVETDSEAVQALLADLAAGELTRFPVPERIEGLTDPDAIPQPPDEPITRPGDLWILGNHHLLCGDARKAKDVDQVLDGAAVHLINTDPPYNVRVEPRSNNAISAGLSSFPQYQRLDTGRDLCRHPAKSKPTIKKLRAKDRPLTNDFLSDADFDCLLLSSFTNIARTLTAGRSFYIYGGFSNLGSVPMALRQCGLYFSQAIIWVKEHPVLTRKDYLGNHEWCFYGWKEGAAHQFFGPANVTDVWSVKKVNAQSMIHLTEKPVELATRAMEYSSKPGENVLDLFGGSGSTLIAAEQTGRKAFLLELDALYCDVIVARWEQFTGRKAEQKANGAP